MKLITLINQLTVITVICLTIKAINVSCIDSFNYEIDERVTLKLVTIIMRDGQHTPSSHFSYIDPFLRSEFWPDGGDELTASGKRELYKLGKMILKRYKTFLKESPREVYARSADSDKNIESALMILHGAYRAIGQWKYDEETNYLPIPVHTVPVQSDCMLTLNYTYPKSQEVIAELIESPEVQTFVTRYQSTLKLVQSKTSLDTLWDQIAYIETVQLQVQLNSQLSAWITPGVVEEFNEMANEFHSLATAYPEMLKIALSNLYAELKSQFTQLISRNASYSAKKLRLLLYSTNTAILSSVAYDLIGVNGVIPPPGTSMVIELYEYPGNHTHFVKLFYWNDTMSHTPYPFQPVYVQNVPNSLDDLLAHLETYAESDLEGYCSQPSPVSSQLDALSIVLICILCVIFASIAFVVFMIVKRSRSGYLLLK